MRVEVSALTYLAIVDTVAIVTGAYLVTHYYPWWGALCFIIAMTTTVKKNN